MIQALTGLALVLYVIVHTIDNAFILVSREAYEDMLNLWHSIPGWLYTLMVIVLVGIFAIHALNGIRIASKPYKNIDISWTHNLKLRHSGTILWFAQVITGSLIAIFGIWHLIVQHSAEPTMFAAQSNARVNPTVFVIYLIFSAALMFHSFNGVRSILIKFGVMTEKAREAVLIGLMALLFIVFFLVGAFSMGKFLPSEEPVMLDSAVNGTHAIEAPVVMEEPD